MVPQHNKVRPVLNVSSPIGSSFNDNVNKNGPEKLKMSSSKKFGQSLLDAGKGAKMTKFDMQNAYKIVPCNMKDLRLQGFKWAGRFFVETTQPFGAITAVSNYHSRKYCLHLGQVSLFYPKKFGPQTNRRCAIVAPKDSSWCEDFTSEYERICNDLNISLAPDCPEKDKAFKISTKGKVLGINFDSENLTWSLPSDKKEEYMNDIHDVLSRGELDLVTGQSLLGKLNFVSTMCPMMRTFKKPLQNLLACL